MSIKEWEKMRKKKHCDRSDRSNIGHRKIRPVGSGRSWSLITSHELRTIGWYRLRDENWGKVPWCRGENRARLIAGVWDSKSMSQSSHACQDWHADLQDLERLTYVLVHHYTIHIFRVILCWRFPVHMYLDPCWRHFLLKVRFTVLRRNFKLAAFLSFCCGLFFWLLNKNIQGAGSFCSVSHFILVSNFDFFCPNASW